MLAAGAPLRPLRHQEQCPGVHHHDLSGSASYRSSAATAMSRSSLRIHTRGGDDRHDGHGEPGKLRPHLRPDRTDAYEIQRKRRLLVAGVLRLISGGGSVLTWTLHNTALTSSIRTRTGASAETLAITFAVRRSANPKAWSAQTVPSATLTFGTDSGCSNSPQNAVDTLLFTTQPSYRRPVELRRNQRRSRSNPVYGNNNDDVVWRINVSNTALPGFRTPL